MRGVTSGSLWLGSVLAVLAAPAIGAARAAAADATQTSVFVVPQVRCDTAPAGTAVGPTGFGLVLSASLREPAVVGHYLDLARCHLANGTGPRLAEAEDMLNQALTRVKAERQAHPAPPVSPAADGTPIRVGGAVPSPAKVKDAPAMYPAEARANAIAGVVFLDVEIDPDGNVKDVRVVGSIPALDEAAVAAVRQWKYAPTVLNGIAVTVVKLVTIKFSTIPGSAVTDGVDVARFHEAQGHYADAEAALTQTLAIVRDLRRQPRSPDAGAPTTRLVRGAAGEIRAPVKVFDARPIYPPGAAKQRVQGVVTIEATITKDGLVTNAHVIKSVPQLDDAALTAARQWRYTPATNDGLNADVITTVNVKFELP